MEGVLTTSSAASAVERWINDRAGLPPARTQYRSLLEQLAHLCAAEVVRRGGDEDQLWTLLNEAAELLHSLWYVAAPKVATKWWRDGETPNDEEKKIIAQAKGVIWIRHEPHISFMEGFESKSHFSCSTESLNFTLAEYLEKPWLRHPVLDAIFLDMLITNEICRFGEHIKVKHSVAKTMGYADFEPFKKWFWLTLVVPVGAFWGMSYDYTKIGWWILGIWVSIWIFIINIRPKLIRSKLMTRHESYVKLWLSMRDVWDLLNGPVLNPTRIREAMRLTTDAGAVWENSAWAIIDRVILHDPAVWIVTY